MEDGCTRELRSSLAGSRKWSEVYGQLVIGARWVWLYDTALWIQRRTSDPTL